MSYASERATAVQSPAEQQAEQLDRDMANEAGRRLALALDRLGMGALTVSGTTWTTTAYEPRRHEQLDGMPAHLGNQAKQAVQRHRQLVQALEVKDRAAQQWCADNQIDGVAREAKIKVDIAEQRTAVRLFEPQMERALQNLGYVIGEAARLRLKRAQRTMRIRHAEQELALCAAEEDADQLTAAQLGLSE